MLQHGERTDDDDADATRDHKDADSKTRTVAARTVAMPELCPPLEFGRGEMGKDKLQVQQKNQRGCKKREKIVRGIVVIKLCTIIRTLV